MKLKSLEIKKILVISLSNIGDVILTFPVMDILKRDFSFAQLSVVVGPKAAGLFMDNPNINHVYIFDKKRSPWDQLRWVLNLRKEKFDAVIDLRHTAIPLFSSTKYRTPLIFRPEKKIHMKQKHLNRLKSVHDFTSESKTRFLLVSDKNDDDYVHNILKGSVRWGEKIVVVAPGAANHNKRWSAEGFAHVCDGLLKQGSMRFVFLGDMADEAIARTVINKMRHPSQTLNMCGKTTLTQLAVVLKRAALVLANDSAIMHMASYLDVPTLGIFGPSDAQKYGPWGSRSLAVRKDVFCAPCGKSGCQYNHECIDEIKSEDVLKTIDFTPQGVYFRFIP